MSQQRENKLKEKKKKKERRKIKRMLNHTALSLIWPTDCTLAKEKSPARIVFRVDSFSFFFFFFPEKSTVISDLLSNAWNFILEIFQNFPSNESSSEFRKKKKTLNRGNDITDGRQGGVAEYFRREIQAGDSIRRRKRA